MLLNLQVSLKLVYLGIGAGVASLLREYLLCFLSCAINFVGESIYDTIINVVMNRDGVLDDNRRKTGYSNKRAILENYIEAGYRVL